MIRKLSFEKSEYEYTKDFTLVVGHVLIAKYWNLLNISGIQMYTLKRHLIFHRINVNRLIETAKHIQSS